MIHRGLLFWSVVAVATAVGLFTVKYKVQDLEERIDRTNQKIIESQQATHILRVEWAHLNEAERIEKLALKHLKLEQASIKQVVRLDSLKPESVPPRRDPPLPSPPRTGNDVPSSTLPGGGRAAAEAGNPLPRRVVAAVDPAHPFPQVVNKSLNFIVSLSGKDAFGRGTAIAILKAPRVLPRVPAFPRR